MGKIYKRGDIWYVDVTVDGTRYRRRVGKSKQVAELALKDLEVKAAKKSYGLDVPDGLIDELFEAYLDYSETNHAPKTTQRYRNVIKNFKLYLSITHPRSKKISDLKFELFEKYKKWRRTTDPRKIKLPEDMKVKIAPNAFEGNPRTINYEIKTLRSIFNFGKKHGFCHKNPTEGVALFRVMETKEPRFLTKEEIRMLLESSEEHYRPIFETFIHTGLRLGELANLQWGDIDFRRKVLKVRQKTDWKPKASERNVPLSERMVDLMSSMRPKDYKKSDYVFTGRDGLKLTPKVRQALIRNARNAGLEDVTKVHTLRHTFASHLVMSGVDLPTVQRLLGHSDIQTTMIYAHLAEDHVKDAVNKLNFD